MYQLHLICLRLRELLSTGVGYHHAGLEANDRRIVEDLFVSGKLLVLSKIQSLIEDYFD